MNPIYRFYLTVNGVQTLAKPVYSDGLALIYEREQNQQFYRASLSGKLTFNGSDYTSIVGAAFDSQFIVDIEISYDNGNSWSNYWSGTFWKTNCEFDADNHTVIVQPETLDKYNDILAGLDKEYNLIDLAPEIFPVKVDKRPCIQIYVPGQTSIGCFLSGMWWEQECEAITNETDLVNIYKFLKNREIRTFKLTGITTPVLPLVYVEEDPNSYLFDLTNGGWRLRCYYWEDPGDPGTNGHKYEIINVSDGVVYWEYDLPSNQPLEPPFTITLSPVYSGAEGDVTLDVTDMPVYGRILCDTDTLGGSPTYDIPSPDICPENRNYHKVIGYVFTNCVYFSDQLSNTPSQWGIYQPNQYYLPPVVAGDPELFPIARNAWGITSAWFASSNFSLILEATGRKGFELKHAYPIYSVIDVLLKQVSPTLTHEGNTTYSEFLYSTNLLGINQRLMISPKSNIVTAGYDEPAQKAPITLGEVFDMLRDCFRCYWFVDSSNKLRIEHIEYFRNGGTYLGTPTIGIDLTAEVVSRNGKPWDFARNQWQFNKPDMEARYQFHWMDDCTQYFEGFPIDIISKYVKQNNVKNIDIAKFTSDIDYILLNPNGVSKDGFVLMGTTPANETEGETVNAAANIHDFFQFDLRDYVGQTLTIRVLSDLSGVNLYQSHLGASRVAIGTISTANVVQTFTFTVESGKDTISFFATSNYTITLLSVIAENPTRLELPYIVYQVDGHDHYLQNGYAAFAIMQGYYKYDMPAYDYEINGVSFTALGIKRLKYQNIKFPCLTDPNLLELIKTNLGNGTIRKLSLNLSSRNADTTLEYDTE